MRTAGCNPGKLQLLQKGFCPHSSGLGEQGARQSPAAATDCAFCLQEHRGLLSIRYPMEHGIVKDWNDMERIWQYVYSKDQLQTFSEEVRGPCAGHYCAGCHAGQNYTPAMMRMRMAVTAARMSLNVCWHSALYTF